MRVLVVDDDSRIVAAMAALLRSEDCIIDTAYDGKLALDNVEKHDYELIISDIAMPKMGGLEFFENVKRVKPDVPFIFLTAYPEFEHVVRAMDEGVLAFIVKPFDNDTIVQLVEQARNINLERRGREIAMKNMTVPDSEWVFDTATLMGRDTFYPLVCYLVGKMQAGCEESRVKRLKLALSIHEALRNALEHGNLELSSGMKPEFMLNGSEDAYHRLLGERLADPAYADKKVVIRHVRKSDRLELTIRDEGKGFDHRSYTGGAKSPTDIGSHGNGILMMRSGVSEISYNGVGNEVTLICLLQ